MNWTLTYTDTIDPLYYAVGETYLWKIRRSDGKWILSGKLKNRPGPYRVMDRDDKLSVVKAAAESFETPISGDVFNG